MALRSNTCGQQGHTRTCSITASGLPSAPTSPYRKHGSGNEDFLCTLFFGNHDQQAIIPQPKLFLSTNEVISTPFVKTTARGNQTKGYRRIVPPSSVSQANSASLDWHRHSCRVAQRNQPLEKAKNKRRSGESSMSVSGGCHPCAGLADGLPQQCLSQPVKYW